MVAQPRLGEGSEQPGTRIAGRQRDAHLAKHINPDANGTRISRGRHRIRDMNPGRAASVSLLLTLLASWQLGHSVAAIAQTGSQAVSSAAEPLAWTIKDAMVADGTGSALARLDVRFEGDTIREIGVIGRRAPAIA